MRSLPELLQAGAVQRDVAIGQMTTYKLGGAAAYFADAADLAGLEEIGAAARSAGLAMVVIGRGSNLLVADAGFDGLAVRLGAGFSEIEISGELVAAGGAVGLPQLARVAAKAGRGDLEWCVGVPGSVGGAVAMNAGCFGSDTAGVLVEATLHDLATGETRTVGVDALDMAYRSSAVRTTDVCVSATFRSSEVEPADAEATMREITRWRRDNQPGGTYNAGSVFKNPPGDAAGRVIDDLGLKGLRHGDVAVSERHANFFTAGPDATAQDVHDLIADVQGAVLAATGVLLEPEIRMVGAFTGQDDRVNR